MTSTLQNPDTSLPLLRREQTFEQKIALAMLAQVSPDRVKNETLPHQWKGEGRTIDLHQLIMDEVLKLGFSNNDLNDLPKSNIFDPVERHLFTGKLLQRIGQRFMNDTLQPKDPKTLFAGAKKYHELRREMSRDCCITVNYAAACYYARAIKPGINFGTWSTHSRGNESPMAPSLDELSLSVHDFVDLHEEFFPTCELALNFTRTFHQSWYIVGEMLQRGMVQDPRKALQAEAALTKARSWKASHDQ